MSDKVEYNKTQLSRKIMFASNLFVWYVKVLLRYTLKEESFAVFVDLKVFFPLKAENVVVYINCKRFSLKTFKFIQATFCLFLGISRYFNLWKDIFNYETAKSFYDIKGLFSRTAKVFFAKRDNFTVRLTTKLSSANTFFL